MTQIEYCFRFVPFGAGFLVFGDLLLNESLLTLFSTQAFYFVTQVSALAAHGFVVLPVIYAAICRSNPFTLLFAACNPMIAGFIASSRWVSQVHIYMLTSEDPFSNKFI